GAGSASADDGSTGKNLFIGSTDLTSFMAQEKAPAGTTAPATAQVSVQAPRGATADQAAVDLGQTNFALTYAN
uniref:hypothetical protein n=1 Tax=Arenibaculum pallidiluteum TaxID=2812559 RepID=UPI001A979327